MSVGNSSSVYIRLIRMDTIQSVLGKMYPFVTAIHMTANYLKWTLLLLHQKSCSTKAGQNRHLHENFWRLWTINCAWIESYFTKTLNSAVQCKWSLKWVKLIRVTEHAIKFEIRSVMARYNWNTPDEIFFSYILPPLFHILFSVKLLMCNQGQNLFHLLYYRKCWLYTLNDTNRYFVHCCKKILLLLAPENEVVL